MAIKRITVAQSEKLLSDIADEVAQFGVNKDIGKLSGRDACILAEAIFTAVDNYRAANRKPRAK